MSTIKRSKFTVLTVNDVYELEPNEFQVGGMAELHTMIKEKKKGKKDCIVTLNGDFLSASALAIKLKGAHMIDILNTMPFDLVSIGNHEFDFGSEVLVERMGETKEHIKYLNSNIFETESKKLLSKTHETHIMTLEDGTKVGFFAVCTQKTPELSKPGNGVFFEDIIACSKRLVKQLRSEGCDCVVAITHLDIATDRILAQAVPTIDIMLGGHDHNIHSQYQGEVFIHKSGQNGQFLSEIEFSIEKKTLKFGDKSLTKISVLPNIQIILNRGYEPDQVTKGRIDEWNKMLPKDSSEQICLIAKTLDSRTERVRTRETNMASLFADAIKVAFDADMAFVTGGAVRGDSTYYPGTYFTKGMLDKEAPFPNKCMVVEITGKTFLEAVEFGLSKAGQTVGSWPHFSRGINIEFDHNLPIGSRIVRALFKNKAIDPEKTYTFASNSFIFEGGDGYAAFKTHKKIEHKNNGKVMSDCIREWMEELKLINYDEYDLRLYEKGQYNMWKVIYDKLKE